jgi:hypothetical protein
MSQLALFLHEQRDASSDAQSGWRRHEDSVGIGHERCAVGKTSHEVTDLRSDGRGWMCEERIGRCGENTGFQSLTSVAPSVVGPIVKLTWLRYPCERQRVKCMG